MILLLVQLAINHKASDIPRQFLARMNDFPVEYLYYGISDSVSNLSFRDVELGSILRQHC